MSRRMNYTGQQKIAILREHLVENVPVSEVCKKDGISVVNFDNWQKILFEEGAALFERKPNASNVRRQEAAAVKQVQELEAAVTRKNEVIAELPEATVRKWKKCCGKAYEHNSWIPRALSQDGEESLYSTCDAAEHLRCTPRCGSLWIAVDRFVTHYNTTRLHSALGYVTPLDMLECRQKSILEERARKLEKARNLRGEKRRLEKLEMLKKLPVTPRVSEVDSPVRLEDRATLGSAPSA